MSIFNYLPFSLEEKRQSLLRYKETFSVILDTKNLELNNLTDYKKKKVLLDLVNESKRAFKEMEKASKEYKKLNWFTDFVFAFEDSSQDYRKKYQAHELTMKNYLASLENIKTMMIGYMEEVMPSSDKDPDKNQIFRAQKSFFGALFPRGQL
jgi:hypothetical protein